ncbi:MAG: UDP-N-acetylglucosamine 1-carboxyvinyltransferase [Synergistales bacterium]|nr:UDP-N-acetylglucosamine 1-carboxyvinyltransferase [Synergistales bacterium]
MDYKLRIEGGTKLKGKIVAQGAKNAALPIMAASLLLKGQKLSLERVPYLKDVNTMIDLLRKLGVQIDFKDHHIALDVPEELCWETPANLVRKMRASSLVLGPLIARCGRAILPLPGGCSIGSRPIDLHLKGLARMGATIELVHGAVHAHANGLRGCRIYLDFPSVGATENLLMAAVFAQGETVIENAAREPEIGNLIQTLISMGARIEERSTGEILVEGVDELQGCQSEIIPDRIEASTYLLAGVITRGEVTVDEINTGHVDALLAKLEESGVPLTIEKNSVTVHPVRELKAVSLKTMPFPGFPTDLQPQIMSTLALANGTSIIQESVFESRFRHISELNKMGASIEVQGHTAIVKGVRELIGADVQATDLRAGASLILAGLAAFDETNIFNLGHVWRGYEDLHIKLTKLGGRVEILPVEEIESKVNGINMKGVH